MDNEIVKLLAADATQSNTKSRDILVLVVDDDHTFLTVIDGILRNYKYNVETVRNGVEALSSLRSSRDKKIDLVMTDVHIPDMNGFELIKRISTEFQIPIVLLIIKMSYKSYLVRMKFNLMDLYATDRYQSSKYNLKIYPITNEVKDLILD
ncbi:hypothetical protein QQ045_026360 [Rhodiola kirilowii]